MNRQSVSVDCAQINSGNVGIFVLSLSIISAFMQTFCVKAMKGPSGFLTSSNSGVSVVAAHAKKF